MDEMLPRDGSSEKGDLEDAELDARIRKLEEELAELRALRVRRRTESKKREFTGSDYERLLRDLEKMGFSRQAAAPVLDDCAKQAASDEEILKNAVERLISAGANDSIHLEKAPLELSHSASSSSHSGPPISAPSSSSSHAEPPRSPELQQLIAMGFDSKEAAAAIEKEGPNMERLIEVMLGRAASSHGTEEKHAVLEDTAKVKQTKQTVGGGRFSTPLKRPVPRNDKLEMPLLDCDSPAALDHTRDQPRSLLRSHSPGVSEVKAPPKKQKLEERGALEAGVNDEAMEGDKAESEHEHNADFPRKSQDCIGPAPEEVLHVNHEKTKQLEETRKRAQEAAAAAKEMFLQQKLKEKEALEATRRALAATRAEVKGKGRGAKKTATEATKDGYADDNAETQAATQAADID